MTVPANDRRKVYDGDGVTTIFNGPMAYSATHITAALVEIATGVVSSAGSFTVTQLGKSAGTRVTMAVAPPALYRLVLLRTTPYSQIVDITNQGSFNASVLEQGMDLLDMQIQQLADDNARTPRLGEADVDGNGTYDGNGNRLGNIADAVSQDDVPNLAQVTGLIGPGSGPFLQEGAGAVIRTYQDKDRDIVSVKDFGAVGNDVADDTLAIQRAVDATPNFGSLYFPAGSYVCTAPITLGDKCITIYGAGFLNSVVRFSNGTNGFVITNTDGPPLDDAYTVTIRDLWIFTNNQSDASTAKAIHYSQPAPPGDGGQPQMSLLVQNCYFSGIFKFDQWWPFAIYVENAPNTLIDRCFYQGKANTTKGDAFYAAGKSDVFVVRDCQIIFCHSGVTQESNDLDDFGSEGLIVRNTGIDDCDFGVRKLHQNASGVGEPLLEVVGCQISARGIGIYSVNAYDVSIHDCLIYLQGTALEPIEASPYGIRLDKTVGATMNKFTVAQCGISLLDNPSGTGTGVYTAVGEGQVALCRFFNFDGPAITVDATNVYVARNNAFENCPSTVSNLSGSAVTDQMLVPMPGSGFPTDDGLWTPPYGSEMLTNGYFDSASGWTLGAGWSIASGLATHVTPTGGTLTRSISVIAGVRYRIEVAFRQWTAGGATVGFTGGTDVLESLPSQGGTHVIYATAATGNSALAVVAGGGFDASISSISVRAVRS